VKRFQPGRIGVRSASAGSDSNSTAATTI